MVAACLLCVTTSRASPSTEAPLEPADDSLRGPRRWHVGVDVLVFFPEVGDSGSGVGLHGRYRLGDGLVLVGTSLTRLDTWLQGDKCRRQHCPRNRGSLTADAELHFLDRTGLPLLDPYVGARLGPGWSSGVVAPSGTLEETDDPGTTFGAAYDVTVGLDLHLWYAAVGLAYRLGSIDDTTYAALAARFEARF